MMWCALIILLNYHRKQCEQNKAVKFISYISLKQCTMLKKGLPLVMAIVLVASLAIIALVSNPAFAVTGFKNKAEYIKFLTK